MNLHQEIQEMLQQKIITERYSLKLIRIIMLKTDSYAQSQIAKRNNAKNANQFPSILE